MISCKFVLRDLCDYYILQRVSGDSDPLIWITIKQGQFRGGYRYGYYVIMLAVAVTQWKKSLAKESDISFYQYAAKKLSSCTSYRKYWQILDLCLKTAIQL